MAIPGMARELNQITPQKVIMAIEMVLGYSEEEIKDKTRKREIVEARQIFFSIIKKNTKMSLSSIGKLCRKDHATVLHSIKTVENLCETDKSFLKKYQAIKEIAENNISIHSIASSEIKTVGSTFNKQRLEQLINSL